MVRCLVAMATTALTSPVVLLRAMVDTGSGVDSVLLGGTADTITLTGALTSTSVTAGGGADSLVVKANVASGYFDISAVL